MSKNKTTKKEKFGRKLDVKRSLDVSLLRLWRTKSGSLSKPELKVGDPEHLELTEISIYQVKGRKSESKYL